MTLLSIDSEENLDHDARMPAVSTPTDEYTMKIVLTVKVEAFSHEQAEVLASHIAAFLPEDAERVADAFSPALMMPLSNRLGSSSRGRRQKSSVATARVTTVTSGAQEAAAEPFHSSRQSHGSHVRFTGRGATSSTSSPTSVTARTSVRRSSIYTRRSQ